METVYKVLKNFQDNLVTFDLKSKAWGKNLAVIVLMIKQVFEQF